MKKKVFLVSAIIFILVAGLFLFTGCGAKKENSKQDVAETPAVVDESLVKINGLEFHLDKDAEFKDVKYKIVGDFKEANFDHYVQYYYYQENSTNLLFFRIFNYEGKTNEEIVKDLGLEGNITFTDGKTDNMEYKLYEEPRNDGGTIHFYFVNRDETTYVFNFVSKYDIKDFENKVIKSVNF